MLKRFFIEFFVFILVIFVLQYFTKENAKREGELRLLEYGKIFKGFIIILNTLMISYVTIPFLYYYKELSWYIGLPLILWVLSFVSFFIYVTFFIKTSYDEDYIYYSGIKVKNKKIHWKHLSKLTSSKALPFYMLEFDGFRIYYFSTLNGGKELREFIEKKLILTEEKNE